MASLRSIEEDHYSKTSYSLPFNTYNSSLTDFSSLPLPVPCLHHREGEYNLDVPGRAEPEFLSPVVDLTAPLLPSPLSSSRPDALGSWDRAPLLVHRCSDTYPPPLLPHWDRRHCEMGRPLGCDSGELDSVSETSNPLCDSSSVGVFWILFGK